MKLIQINAYNAQCLVHLYIIIIVMKLIQINAYSAQCLVHFIHYYYSDETDSD